MVTHPFEKPSWRLIIFILEKPSWWLISFILEKPSGGWLILKLTLWHKRGPHDPWTTKGPLSHHDGHSILFSLDKGAKNPDQVQPKRAPVLLSTHWETTLAAMQVFIMIERIMICNVVVYLPHHHHHHHHHPYKLSQDWQQDFSQSMNKVGYRRSGARGRFFVSIVDGDVPVTTAVA